MSKPSFLDRDTEELLGEMEAEPQQAAATPYDEDANGGRWWED